MKRYVTAFALALLLSLSSSSAFAGVVHVSGQGQSPDFGTALSNAQADAIAQCTEQGGTPVEEVYNHMTFHSVWFASSIWSCDVP